jgi:hypothetical protein
MGKGIPVPEFIRHGCVLKVNLNDVADEGSIISIDVGTTLFFLRTVFGMQPFECAKLLEARSPEAHGQRHDALSPSRSNDFLPLEQMMLDEVLEAAASLPNNPCDVDFGFIDNASGLRALFESLHDAAAARGEVARLRVTRTENTRASDVRSFQKDIISLGFDAVFELLGVAEGDPLYLLAEGFDGDCSRPVSHSFRLRVSRLRDKNERCYGYTVRGAWSMIEDNIKSLVFFIRNGRLCFGQAFKDGREFVFPPAASQMLVHVETGTSDELFKSLLYVLLYAAGASTELGSLGVQQGELFSRFSGVGYTDFSK